VEVDEERKKEETKYARAASLPSDCVAEDFSRGVKFARLTTISKSTSEKARILFRCTRPTGCAKKRRTALLQKRKFAT
jgi:hypothetical protein